MELSHTCGKRQKRNYMIVQKTFSMRNIQRRIHHSTERKRMNIIMNPNAIGKHFLFQSILLIITTIDIVVVHFKDTFDHRIYDVLRYFVLVYRSVLPFFSEAEKIRFNLRDTSTNVSIVLSE